MNMNLIGIHIGEFSKCAIPEGENLPTAMACANANTPHVHRWRREGGQASAA
jgi:hypothetical protein